MPITTEACPGPCNNQARKAWDTYDQAVIQHPYELQLHHDRWQATLDAWHPPLVEPVEPPPPARPETPTIPVAIALPVWCRRCPRIIRQALAELDDTAAVLAAGVDGHRGAAMSGPNGVKPLDHRQIVDELDELFGFLVSVEDQWRAARGYPERPRRARGADARMRSVGWLLGVLDDILLDPWSVEVGLDILRWHRRLLRMTKSDPASRRSPIACPRCGERQVNRGDDYYECGSCGRLLNQREHDDEYAKQADEHDHEREVAAS
ncbi:hypothetical protein AB0K40_17905 [Nonomuraea bangladeshensis]|uniref:Zinc ribbon domain-containing protein n=1 Tax=Nonomuraea bangladeshensis TaxID=404385 RepID=A0ABV3H4E3_9ACTN